MSEPIFDTTVRVHADMAEFEREAQASVQRTAADLEKQASAAFQQSLQKAAQPPTVPPQQVQGQVAQVEAAVAVQPPAARAPVEIPVTADTRPFTQQAEAAIEQVKALAAPVEVPLQVDPGGLDAVLATATAASEKLNNLRELLRGARADLATANEALEMIGPKRFAESDFGPELPGLKAKVTELEKAVRLQEEFNRGQQASLRTAVQAGPSPAAPFADLAQQLEQARALAERQIVEVQVGADTRPFEQQTQAAYAEARRLAEAQVAAARTASEQATINARAAVEAVTNASGFAAREQAQASAQASLAAQSAAETAVAETEALLQKIIGEAESARLSVAQEFQTRSATAATQASTAGLQGDTATQAAKELEARILSIQGAEAASRLSAEQLIAQAATVTGAEQQLLQAQAENAIVAAEKLRAEAARLQRAGVETAGEAGAAGGGGAGGAFRRIEELARGSGTRGGIGQLLASGARLGAIGFAATAAFQAVNELSSALRVTGDEAFTAGGKARNAVAELSSANFVGAIRAITAVKPAELSPGLQQEVERLKQVKKENDDLFVSEYKLTQARQRGKVALEEYVGGLALQGHISGETAAALITIGNHLEDQRRITEAAADAWANYTTQVEAAGGSLEKAFGPDSAAAARGPGAFAPTPTGAPAGTVIGQQRTGIPQPIIAVGPNPAFQAGTGGTAVADQIRASITSRIKSEQERLQLDLRDKEIVQKNAKAAFDSAKQVAQASGQTDGAAKEWAAYVAATTDVVNAAAAAKAGTKAAAQATQDLANSVREAWVQAIADPGAQQQAALKLAQDKEAQAKEAFDSAARGSKEAKEAQAKYQIARAERVGIENQISYQAKQAAIAQAKADADAAAAQRASNRAGREAALENAIAVAATTKRISDDKIAFSAAIRYWVSLRNNAEHIEEREAARSKVIDLFQRRRAALAQDETGDDLRLLRIQNDIQAAQLTKGLSDDKRNIKRLIEYWRNQFEDATGLEKERARGNLIAARLQLKNLGQQAGAESAEVFAQALFNQAADEFKRFGSNISTSRGGILAPQDARGAFAGFLGGGTSPAWADATRRVNEAQLTESQKQTGILTGILANTQPRIVGRQPGKPVAPETARVVAELGAAVLRGL